MLQPPKDFKVSSLLTREEVAVLDQAAELNGLTRSECIRKFIRIGSRVALELQ